LLSGGLFRRALLNCGLFCGRLLGSTLLCAFSLSLRLLSRPLLSGGLFGGALLGLGLLSGSFLGSALLSLGFFRCGFLSRALLSLGLFGGTLLGQRLLRSGLLGSALRSGSLFSRALLSQRFLGGSLFRYALFFRRLLRRALLFGGFRCGDTLRLGSPVGGALFHGSLLSGKLLRRRLGGGLAPRLLLAHGLRCECVELDPGVLRVARRDFDLPASLPVTLADGRAFLERDGRLWDLIVLDVCTSERLAAHCFTVEFMELIRRRLAPGGVLAIQFIGDRGGWSASVLRTVRQGFGQAQLLEAGGAFSLPVGPQWILAGRRAWAEPPAQMWPGGRAPWRRLEPAPHEGVLLTDDRFPAEPRWSQVALCWRQLYSQ
jgi:SAM-dependent methyltransferase